MVGRRAGRGGDPGQVTKGKVTPPFRVAEFDIMCDEGIGRMRDLLDVAVELGVTGGGVWSFGRVHSRLC
mgnify:CR=1 FL=1